MHTRPLVLTGLALVGLAGCQSYFPYSRGGAGPYQGFPPETYAPPAGGSTLGPSNTSPGTTYQPGSTLNSSGAPRTAAPPLNKPASATGTPKPVPKYTDPGAEGTPASLGTPADDDDEETIRRSNSRRTSPSGLDGFGDETDGVETALGEEEFAPPERLQQTSALEDADADRMPRQARKPTPSPYKYDAEGHTWLRGTVSRDAQGSGWRLKYSNDPLDGDRYDGHLLLIGDEKLERLLENEVILVQGRVDPSVEDDRGQPAYRVDALKFLKPKR